MRWAFWRRREQEDGAAGERATEDRPRADRPLPDDIGLPGRTPGQGTAVPRPEDPDDDAWQRPRTASSAFSGAVPDAVGSSGGAARSVEDLLGPGAGTPLPALDASSQQAARDAVVDAVRAVLDGDPTALTTALVPLDADERTARYAAVLACRALAARLPGLSGASGPVTRGEDDAALQPDDAALQPDDAAQQQRDDADVQRVDAELQRAYADLLAERADASRVRVAADVPREVVLGIAHLCAAPGRSPGWPTSALPEPVGPALRAACLLLAQTSRDGAPDPDALAAELQRAAP